MKFKTNIRCNGCVQNVRPYMESISGINNWEVDLASKDRIMTVTGEDVTAEKVIAVLNAAGYQGEVTS